MILTNSEVSIIIIEKVKDVYFRLKDDGLNTTTKIDRTITELQRVVDILKVLT